MKNRINFCCKRIIVYIFLSNENQFTSFLMCFLSLIKHSNPLPNKIYLQNFILNYVIKLFISHATNSM